MHHIKILIFYNATKGHELCVLFLPVPKVRMSFSCGSRVISHSELRWMGMISELLWGMREWKWFPEGGTVLQRSPEAQHAQLTVQQLTPIKMVDQPISYNQK